MSSGPPDGADRSVSSRRYGRTEGEIRGIKEKLEITKMIPARGPQRVFLAILTDLGGRSREGAGASPSCGRSRGRLRQFFLGDQGSWISGHLGTWA